MRSLCKLCKSLEKVNKEQDLSISINDLIKLVTQSIMIMGQKNIFLSCHGCLSALDGVMKSITQAKFMLKNKSELLRKENKGKQKRKQKSWNSNRNNKRNGKYANENNLFQGNLNSDSPEKLPYAHKLVNDYSCWVNFQISAGRLKHFVKKLELQTKDLSILEIVKRYQIPFLSQSLQQQLPREIHLNLEKKICSGGGK